MAKAAEETLKATRNASSFFECFDKSLLYHAGAIRDTEWLLSEASTNADADGDHAHAQHRLLEGLGCAEESGRYTLLVPRPSGKPLCLQELHQLTRELVEGVYVFHQVPRLSLEPNHDLSTTCALASAYHDSLVGELMLSVAYFTQGLVHGTTVPQKDKRRKLAECWRKMPPAALHEGYLKHGLVRMEEEEELGGEKLYSEQRPAFVRYPSKCVNRELALEELPPRLTTGEEFDLQRSHVARDVFLRFLNQVSLLLVFQQKRVLQSGPVLVLDPSFEVTTSVVSDAAESGRDVDLYPHLHSYLQRQCDFTIKHLSKKCDIAHALELLGYVSFLIPFLVSLKRQNKIIDVSALGEGICKDLIRTEREFPPMLPSENSRWSPFTTKNSASAMHGGVLFHRFPLSVEHTDLDQAGLQAALHNDREMPVYVHEGRSYHVLQLTVENYYAQSPRLPRWLHAMTAELRSQCARLPTLSDSRVQELLRKPYGQRRAAQLNTVNVSMQASVEREMLPAVVALMKRCTKTRLSRVDESGWSLVHCAAHHCRADNLSALLLSGCSAHTPLHTAGESPQPTLTLPIHLAASSGCLDAVCSLLSHGADPTARDDIGWAPIHHSAFHNYQALVAHFASVELQCIDLRTEDRAKATPLLLAAQNGCFDTVRCLIELGADVTATDAAARNVVHKAVLGHYTAILQHLVSIRPPSLDVWAVLSDMASADPGSGYPEAAVRSLDTLTRWRPGDHGRLLSHGAVASLTRLLGSEQKLQCLAVQVLRNLSNIEAVEEALVEAGAVQPLVQLLASTSDHVHTCACVVLADLGLVPEHQAAIVDAGAIPHLVKLLASESSDVQLFACACIGILAYDSSKNQAAVLEARGLSPLISLLGSPLSCVQASAASSLQAVLADNRPNQLHALSCDIITPLVGLLRSKQVAVHSSAARALEVLAEGCEESQRLLLGNGMAIRLLKRLLKMRDPVVKVSGGCALWAIAGQLISNKRDIATHMGLELLVDMLTIRDEKLDFVCSEALGCLATELGGNQNRIAAVGGVKPLVGVLTTPTSERVVLSVVHTLAALLVRPALVPNPKLQAAVATARGISVLAEIVASEHASEIVRVEAACTLAKLVLNNAENDRYLFRYTSFSYRTVFRFLSSSDDTVRLLAGYCLSVTAFKNPAKLEVMQSIGRLDMALFLPFLQAEEELYRVYAAFQVVVLSRLLSGVRRVEAVVQGIKLLVALCSSPIERTKVLSAEFLACLAHSSGGIPDTVVMAGALDPLYENIR